MHIVDDFWFAEVGYTSERQLKSGEIEIRWQVPNFRLPHCELVSQTESTLTGNGEKETTVRTHVYNHEKLNKTITINFVGGCAVNAFNCLPVEKLAVFVNRGDHRVKSEGSSGICWLSDDGSSPFPQGLLRKVLSKMSTGGFIVSDGSNADELLAPHWNDRDVSVDIHLSVDPIVLHNVQLECIGLLKPKYGPTLVWQIVG